MVAGHARTGFGSDGHHAIIESAVHCQLLGPGIFELDIPRYDGVGFLLLRLYLKHFSVPLFKASISLADPIGGSKPRTRSLCLCLALAT